MDPKKGIMLQSGPIFPFFIPDYDSLLMTVADSFQTMTHYLWLWLTPSRLWLISDIIAYQVLHLGHDIILSSILFKEPSSYLVTSSSTWFYSDFWAIRSLLQSFPLCSIPDIRTGMTPSLTLDLLVSQQVKLQVTLVALQTTKGGHNIIVNASYITLSFCSSFYNQSLHFIYVPLAPIL
jgi:hypothetical protein